MEFRWEGVAIWGGWLHPNVGMATPYILKGVAIFFMHIFVG
ncbi:MULTISPECIES: hypothetical protein [Bacteroides]|nr:MULTISPECIES: hypothetical protein [Bacteroides]MCS2596834.1 hypothetical protein [Bacteroides fragilis]